MKNLIISTALLALIATSVYAEQNPQSMAADYRVKVVNYDPNNVTIIHAHYGYQTMILFDSDETVQNVSLGDALAWQAVPVTNHLFIKPMAASVTNMTVLTNTRSYNFQLESSSDNGGNTYELKFVYPDDIAQYQASAVTSDQNIPPTQCNWKYSYTGDKSQAPIQAFDNGKFTYFKFKQTGSSVLPAIFSVDKDRNETLINYHMEGDYLVINRVAPQYTLRDGTYVTTVYNDALIGDCNRVW